MFLLKWSLPWEYHIRVGLVPIGLTSKQQPLLCTQRLPRTALSHRSSSFQLYARLHRCGRGDIPPSSISPSLILSTISSTNLPHFSPTRSSHASSLPLCAPFGPRAPAPHGWPFHTPHRRLHDMSAGARALKPMEEDILPKAEAGARHCPCSAWCDISQSIAPSSPPQARVRPGLLTQPSHHRVHVPHAIYFTWFGSARIEPFQAPSIGALPRARNHPQESQKFPRCLQDNLTRWESLSRSDAGPRAVME